MRATLTRWRKALRLRRLERRIAYLEQHEEDLKQSLRHLQITTLPALRRARNELMFATSKKGA